MNSSVIHAVIGLIVGVSVVAALCVLGLVVSQ